LTATFRVVGFVLILMIVFSLQPLAVVEANGDPYLEQLVGENSGEGEEGEYATLEDLEVWIANILIEVVQAIQRLSPLIIMFFVLVGAGILLIGGLVGSRTLRGAGVSAILAALAAFLIIRNAPAIILMIQEYSSTL
jgi:hypothetical protein